MTLKDLIEEACALLPDSSVHVECGVWRHIHLPDERPVEYSIWSDKHNRHFKGRTGEEALAKLREFLTPAEPTPLEEVMTGYENAESAESDECVPA